MRERLKLSSFPDAQSGSAAGPLRGALRNGALSPRIPGGQRERIGIVGGGVAGLGAALALHEHADVTVLERESRTGGHAHTVDVDYDGAQVAVDVGFIVYNELNYPNFSAMLDMLGVETLETDMSFSVSDPASYEWSSDPRGVFAWKRNAADPAFLRLLGEIMRFNRLGCAASPGDPQCDESLGLWLDRHGFSQRFRDSYLLPMGGAIWSTPEGEMLNYPVDALLSFFRNHRLMHARRPVWRTLKGGSRHYVDALSRRLGDAIITGAGVEHVRATDGGELETIASNGATYRFDNIIMANHACDAHRQLDPLFDDQRLALGSVHFSKNVAYLHRDPALMPRRKAAWASWNVLKGGDGGVCVTYWMNRLQKIDDDKPLFLTLNPATPPRDELVFDTFEFDHPMYDLTSAAARRTLQRVQGQDGLYFAGAWLGDGFHEAGLRSGLEAAYALGGQVSWDAQLQQRHRTPEPVIASPRIAEAAQL